MFGLPFILNLTNSFQLLGSLLKPLKPVHQTEKCQTLGGDNHENASEITESNGAKWHITGD